MLFKFPAKPFQIFLKKISNCSIHLMDGSRKKHERTFPTVKYFPTKESYFLCRTWKLKKKKKKNYEQNLSFIEFDIFLSNKFNLFPTISIYFYNLNFFPVEIQRYPINSQTIHPLSLPNSINPLPYGGQFPTNSRETWEDQRVQRNCWKRAFG